jgi:hypothetical protein
VGDRKRATKVARELHLGISERLRWFVVSNGTAMSFADIQTAYATHRVATYPLSVDKTPAVKAYDRIGAP